MSNESPSEKQQQQPIRTSKFYATNFRRPRIYPPRRTTMLIDPPETSLLSEDNYKSAKHGSASWTLDSLGSKRFRLHGKVEGNLNKLRMEKDDHCDDDKVAVPSSSRSKSNATRDVKSPVVGTKRSRYASLIDDDEDDE